MRCPTTHACLINLSYKREAHAAPNFFPPTHAGLTPNSPQHTIPASFLSLYLPFSKLLRVMSAPKTATVCCVSLYDSLSYLNHFLLAILPDPHTTGLLSRQVPPGQPLSLFL